MSDKNKKSILKNFDTGSIKTATLMSFVAFAVILLVFLWTLTSFFVNTFYASARTQEIVRTAEAIGTQYWQNSSSFDSYAIETAEANRIYIRIDNPGGSLIYDGTSAIKNKGAFTQDINRVREKLDSSPLDSVTETRVSSSGNSETRFIYAAYIWAGNTQSTLFIIAPLYPDQVTVRIIKGMLTYVSFILITIAILLAYALSRRISSPIENLTASATELSKGNYNVKFDGSAFTETKELARALNKASYEMEKTDFYQREILANVSHDLKTPLTMIRSYAEKIIDISGDNPEKRNSDLQIIISETERLNRMVTDMLSVSNLQSNNVEMHRETFDLVQAARDVYDSFQVLSSSQGYEIQFHPSKAAYVTGDRSKIMQVMTNFVSNAVKYSGDSKYIDIQLARSPRKITFHCIDHGVGIPADEQSHVWDKYYRTSANHERDIEGTGLGLAISKSILNLHNAKYGVNSEEGKGSDFWFEMETVRKPSSKGKQSKDDNSPADNTEE